MFQDMRDEGINNQNDALKQLGETFRGSMRTPTWLSDIEAGKILIRRCILIHLDDNKSKFELLM